MTRELIHERINEIKQQATDDEGAHELEDMLYFDFVKFLSEQDNCEYSEMAKEILTTKNIEFDRWYS
jgi:hypothetical protein